MSGKYLMPIIFFLVFVSCQGRKNERGNSITSEYAKKLEIKYARGFNIYSSDGQVTIQLNNPFQDSSDTILFSFNRKTNISGKEKKSVQLSLPIESVTLLSSTHVAFFNELGKTSIVKGISNKTYFFNDVIQKGITNNEIIEVGYGQNLDFEKTLMLNPQLLIISGMSSNELSSYSKLVDAGIQLFPISEWREEHPLGRAEWIKVFGVLTGELEKSIEIFQQIESEYIELTRLVENVQFQPKVIVNAPYKDIWWLPGGKSYMSYLLKDAGADYPWKEDNNTGGIQADLEAVFYKAGDADFWINPSAFRTKSVLGNMDERFKEFNAFNSEKIYNNTLRTGMNGGNDYFETGNVRPGLILKDLIKIFHPEVIPNHNFYFYEKLK